MQLPFELYLITPPRTPAEILRVANLIFAKPRLRVACALRHKELDRPSFETLARELRKITADAGAHFLVNERVEVAYEVQADGIHLPEHAACSSAFVRDFRLVARSTHDEKGVQKASKDRVHFVTLGPVAHVPDKNPPLSIGQFARIAKMATVPVFALGGVDVQNTRALLSAGASGVALMRGVFDHESPGIALDDYARIVDSERGGGEGRTCGNFSKER